MGLNLLLDNGDPNIWEELLPRGIFNGVTTNPTLLKQAGKKCSLSQLEGLSHKAQELGCKEFHIQAWGKSYIDLAKCGIALSEIKTSTMKTYIKVPITQEGVKAAKHLIALNIPVTLTACFEVKQVLIASALGASYIAPYMGRIKDQGKNAAQELTEMQQVLTGLKSDCKLLVASLRKSEELTKLAAKGVNTFTINKDLAQDIFKVPATKEAANQFEIDSH